MPESAHELETIVGLHASESLYDKRYEEYIARLRREAFIKIYDPALEKPAEKKAS